MDKSGTIQKGQSLLNKSIACIVVVIDWCRDQGPVDQPDLQVDTFSHGPYASIVSNIEGSQTYFSFCISILSPENRYINIPSKIKETAPSGMHHPLLPLLHVKAFVNYKYQSLQRNYSEKRKQGDFFVCFVYI